MTYSPTKKVQNIIPATQETGGPFFQDYPSVDYVFQLPAAYFIQQKDSPFNYSLSLILIKWIWGWTYKLL